MDLASFSLRPGGFLVYIFATSCYSESMEIDSSMGFNIFVGGYLSEKKIDVAKFAWFFCL